jgi:hypothetical protein
MERNTLDLNDPIAKKFDDNVTLERLMRKAGMDAVDNARKLAFVDEKGIPLKQMEKPKI